MAAQMVISGDGFLEKIKQSAIFAKYERILPFRVWNPLVAAAVAFSCLFHMGALLGILWLAPVEPESNILFVHFRQKIFRDTAEEQEPAATNATAGAGPVPVGGARLASLPVKEEVTVRLPVGAGKTLDTLRKVKETIAVLWAQGHPPAGGKVMARLLIASEGRVVSIEVDQLSGPPSLGAFVAEMLRGTGSFKTAMEQLDEPLSIECEFTVTETG